MNRQNVWEASPGVFLFLELGVGANSGESSLSTNRDRRRHLPLFSSLKNWMTTTTTKFFLIISELIAPLWPQDEEGHMPEGIFPPTPPATPPTSEAVSNNPRGEEGGGGHRQISGISHICQTCNKSYASRAKLNEHVNFRHSEARPHRCLQCPKVFKSASNLKAHFKRTHERLRFTCPDCPLGLGK